MARRRFSLPPLAPRLGGLQRPSNTGHRPTRQELSDVGEPLPVGSQTFLREAAVTRVRPAWVSEPLEVALD